MGGPIPYAGTSALHLWLSGADQESSRAHWRSRGAICELALTCLVTDAVEAREPGGTWRIQGRLTAPRCAARCL